MCLATFLILLFLGFINFLDSFSSFCSKSFKNLKPSFVTIIPCFSNFSAIFLLVFTPCSVNLMLSFVIRVPSSSILLKSSKNRFLFFFSFSSPNLNNLVIGLSNFVVLDSSATNFCTSMPSCNTCCEGRINSLSPPNRRAISS